MMDLMLSGWSWGVRLRKKVCTDASVVDSGSEEMKRETMDWSAGGVRPVDAVKEELWVMERGGVAMVGDVGAGFASDACGARWTSAGSSCLNGHLSPLGQLPLAYAEQNC